MNETPRPTHRSRRGATFIAGFACMLMGCGGGQTFSHSLDEMWQWDGGVEASRVLGRVAGKKGPQRVPAAVGVTGRGLVGRTLPDGKLWKYEGEVDVLPTLAGDLVLFSGDGKVTALDVRTGVQRYSFDVANRRLEGAGYDGKKSILLLVDTDDAREDQIVVVGPNGERLYSTTANTRLGTPAAIADVGLVPYSGQYVGALDLSTNEHIGRILVRDGLHTVQAKESHVILYGAGATLLDDSLTSSPDSRSLKLEPRELPGDPAWPIDGSKPRPARGEPVGIYVQPAVSEGTLRIAAGVYVATYFEIVIGLNQSTNEIRWATHFPRAVAGGAAGPNGPAICLENGGVYLLSLEDGTQVPHGSLESKVKACVVTAPDISIPSGKRPPVLQQLAQTIAHTGPDMVAMQRLLLGELATSKTADTTKALLAVAQNPLISADLTKQAATLLAKRRTGGEEMIAALLASAPKPPKEETNPVDTDPKETDPQENDPGNEGSSNETPKEGDEDEEGEPKDEESELKGEGASIDPNATQRETLRPPPVGALARALTRMKTEGAAAALALYLDDPSLRAGAALSVVRAIDALGGQEQVPQMRSFLDSYKNTGGEDQLLDALALTALFLFKHLGEEEAQELRESLNQSLTHPELRKRLERAEALEKAKDKPRKKTKDKSDSKTEGASSKD